MTSKHYPRLALLAACAALIGCTGQSDEPVAGSAVAHSGDRDTGSADAGSSNAAKSNVVVLGDPSLTSGIPGEGDLSAEEIKAWVDEPANHEVLDFSLPVGLAAATAQISGVDENALTRAKIELGRQLYFDPRLSADHTISCASCHHPHEGYGKHTRFGVGIRGQEGGRNSPISYNRIVSSAQFWDGRAATLEEQAVGPIENPIEMGNTHEAAVETVKGIEGYALQFEKVFPEEGCTIDTIGKAIATFERAIVTGPAPYDFYDRMKVYRNMDSEILEDERANDPEFAAEYDALVKAAEEHPMSESAIRGYELFFSERVACTACHAGANFADEKYHNLGVGMEVDEPDLGRYEVTENEKDRGAFKTPTIRNVEFSAPYMHDGSQQTLEEVVEWYSKGGHPNPNLDEKIKKLDLKDQEKKDLVEFMKACTGDFPPVETGRLPAG